MCPASSWPAPFFPEPTRDGSSSRTAVSTPAASRPRSPTDFGRSMAERFERDFLKRLEGSRVGEEEIRRLLSNREARKFHAVRRALAAHPRSPRAEALSLIPTLFW